MVFDKLFGKKRRIPSALDVDGSHFNDYEKNLVEKVREYGFFIPYVVDDGPTPNFRQSFGYTVGLWRSWQVPEVIVFGLPSDNCQGMLSEIADRAAAGTPVPTGKRVSDVATGLDIALLPIRPAEKLAHLRSARWFYGQDDFPAVQLVWPDTQGLFPWQDGFDARFANDQPDLSPTGWAKLAKSWRD